MEDFRYVLVNENYANFVNPDNIREIALGIYDLIVWDLDKNYRSLILYYILNRYHEKAPKRNPGPFIKSRIKEYAQGLVTQMAKDGILHSSWLEPGVSILYLEFFIHPDLMSSDLMLGIGKYILRSQKPRIKGLPEGL